MGEAWVALHLGVRADLPWLAAHASGAAVAELLRVAWRSVTAIVEWVVADATGSRDLLAGVTRIGIDEIAHRKGHRYLTAVTDHDTGRLIWAAPGRDQATVKAFFDALGPERAARITHVSADGAEWIHAAVRSRASRRSSASTRSTWSAGPPKPSTKSAAANSLSCALWAPLTPPPA